MLQVYASNALFSSSEKRFAKNGSVQYQKMMSNWCEQPDAMNPVREQDSVHLAS